MEIAAFSTFLTKFKSFYTLTFHLPWNANVSLPTKVWKMSLQYPIKRRTLLLLLKKFIYCFTHLNRKMMNYEIVLSRNGYQQVLQIFADTFNNLKVWKVRFQNGEEAVLFKCGTEWFQRNEDGLDRRLLKEIGLRIDHINIGIALS